MYLTFDLPADTLRNYVSAEPDPPPEGVARLQALMDAESFKNRSAVGHRVCEEFGFHDACGGAQLVGCMKVLRDLDATRGYQRP